MRTSKWFTIVLAASLVAGGLVAFKSHATERQATARAGHAKFLERAKEKLSLTDEQISKIHDALRDDHATLTSLATSLHQARVTLRQTIQSGDSTEAAIRDASAKVAAVQADLAVERHKLYGKISPILTADQREKVKQFLGQIDDFVEGAIQRFGQNLATQ